MPVHVIPYAKNFSTNATSVMKSKLHATSPKTDDILERARAALRANRMRLTEPRVKMIRALADSSSLLTTEQLHESIKHDCDLVTVYRSLAALHKIGFVNKIYSFNGTALYTLRIATPEYLVISRSESFSEKIAPNFAGELEAAVRRATEELERAGYRDVQPIVQFFGDRAVARLTTDSIE